MDYEVCRKVWESQIAVQFTLQSDDALPFYTMLPRCSYFAISLPKILAFFTNREGGSRIDQEKVWLETNGTPLKLYLPIGVLFDLQNLDLDGTWNITVRTTNQPVGYAAVDRDAMECMFMQSVKEADYLKRKAETMNKMQKEDHKQLWSSIANYHFDDFWSINKKLMDTSEKNFENIPLRVYQRDKPFRQTLIPSHDENGLLVTIKRATEDLLKLGPVKKLVSHGIELPPETPLLYAAKNLSYPDNFVHISVVN